MQKPCRKPIADTRPTELHANEIRDYINRAPKKWDFDGLRMINNTHARLIWLASIAHGTLDERINRRAGIKDLWQPWMQPFWVKAAKRHRRNTFRKRGIRLVNP